jgi:Zn-dependent protease
MQIIVMIPILFFSIVLHEFAHGFAAYRMGDNTAYYAGRLTLNPLAHVDIVGTFILPALCYFLGLPMFGWAKPVPVNPARLPSPRKDMGKVALAGPVVNLTLALVFMVGLKLVDVFGEQMSDSLFLSCGICFQYGVLVNILLAVFNLIPIPPLDGGRIVTALLPVNTALAYDRFFSRFGMWLVFVLILSGGVRYILWPVSTFIYNLLLKIVGL